MSAIFGAFFPDASAEPRLLLEDMARALAHRGGDGKGVWCAPGVGLGHQMRWTTPESLLERLPSDREVPSLAITADARIDNRDELLAVLDTGGRPHAEIADSEIVLAAYARWGEDCAVRLVGDFVFAIWDGRRRALFLARDPFGAKHFYYHHEPGRLFAFASEIKALFRAPGVPRTINERSVADHLMPTLADKTSTFYEDVWRLPAGQCLTVTADGLRQREFYAPDLEAELRLGSDEEYAEAFRERFTEAVRRRTRSAFPVGATLSGGLDSSSIACTARLLLEAEGRLPVHTFSAEWPSLIDVDPKVDERRFIDAVTSIGGIEPHFVRADEYTPLSFLDRITWHIDGVLAAPNIYATWSILEEAQRYGVRALFHGTDGDTTVSYGYEDLMEFARRGWCRTLVREARALATNMPSRQHRLSSLLWRQTLKPLALELAPEWAKDFRSVVRGRPRADGRKSRVYERCDSRPFNPDFARRVNLRERYWDLSVAATPPKVSPREYHWRAVTCGMFSHLLEAFESIGAPFSVEFRYPFFDRRLVEFCLALPPGQRLNRGWTRSILRRAMTGILPPEVQWRKGKGNLSANVRLLMKRERSTLDEVFLGESDDVLGDYVDLASLRALYGRVRQEPLLSQDDSYFMLLVVNLHRWLQTARQLPSSG